MSKKKRKKEKAAKKGLKKAGPKKKVEIKKRKTQDLWKKKKWYRVLSSKTFDEKEIGSTVGEVDKKVIGRIILVPLYELTGNISQQFFKLKFRIEEIKGLTAYTKLIGFEISSDYIRRNVRRRRSMIRTISEVTFKDNRKGRITAYTFTHRKINSSQKQEIARIMKENINNDAKLKSLESFVKKCSNAELSKEILKKVKKICPIKRVEIGKCKEI